MLGRATVTYSHGSLVACIYGIGDTIVARKEFLTRFGARHWAFKKLREFRIANGIIGWYSWDDEIR